ncbi:MAG: hormogonium polysaccharide biosynthesis protein HpsA [Trichodesmium sp. MAG_R04]|nr:hormogonium polysaccharide biosynthesis protein HpsA [Trichodesmium sp. MAG_R04]
MSKPKVNRRIHNNLHRIFKPIEKFVRITANKLIRLFINPMIRQRSHPHLTKSGYVLPTVTMVMLMVVLLTFAMMFRSFQRTEQALYLRTNEAALASGAGPGIERALAKVREVEGSADQTMTEAELNTELIKDKYTLPGETRLTIAYDIPEVKNSNVTEIYDQKTIDTAWKFPVDTDGNGVYDSFDVYGIFLRSPKLSQNELVFERSRTPLDAVAPPIPAVASLKPGCERLGVSRATVGATDWYKVGATLKKSIFVYSVVVPIGQDEVPSENNYEFKREQAGLVALELQQDQERVPLSNNTVVYEDDLQITPGSSNGIKLNGRIFTNSNLLTAKRQNGGSVEYYLVSSPNSCFYEMENNKIVVGGNVGIGPPDSSSDMQDVIVDLFDINSTNDNNITKLTMGSANKPVTNTPNEITYDERRYEERLQSLLDNTNTGDEPQEVKDKIDLGKDRKVALYEYFKARTRRVPSAEASGNDDISPQGKEDNPATLGGPLRPPQDVIDIDNNGLTLKISGENALPAATEPDLLEERGIEKQIGDRVVIGNGLPAKWYKEVQGRFATFNDEQDMSDVEWDEYREDEEDQDFRYRQTRIQPIGDLDPVRNGFWELAAAEQPEFLFSGRGGLRVITGAGVYERKNSFLPPPPDLNDLTVFTPSDPGTNPPDYDDPGTSNINEQFRIVWPDSMPMSPLGILDPTNSDRYLVKGYDNSGGTEWGSTSGSGLESIIALRGDKETAATPTVDSSTYKYMKGDLKMRATAVYMYNKNAYDAANPGTYQKPVACVSSYYDPTDAITARNQKDLPWAADSKGKSNNGIVYGPPTTTAAALTVPDLDKTTGLYPADEYGDYNTLEQRVAYQANLVFPSGRFANPTLRYALEDITNSKDLTLSKQSAIDSTICALQILDGTITPSDTLIPHGAIREVAFLDGRQIRANEGGDKTQEYDLFVEDRQPLEIRVTQLDLDLMRKQSIGNMSIQNPPDSPKPEFLLPNSGVIYATRDDALPDVSARPDSEYLPIDDENNQNLTASAIDFKLDSTRRPNGIMLVNGSVLARENNNNDYNGKEAERGIILASNVPVYVQADDTGFNLHQQSTNSSKALEEFTDFLDDDWSNFYNRDTLEAQFACRKNDPRFQGRNNLADCNPGDLWRPATVISDAVTLLSHNFRPGFRVEADYDLRNNANIANDNNLGGKGFDFDNDNSTDISLDETKFKLDLNGNGDYNDTAVKESEITAAAAHKLKRLKNGFYDNNFVTSFKWFSTLSKNRGYPTDFDNFYDDSNNSLDIDGGTFKDTTNTEIQYFSGSDANSEYSSYFSNFITPVQRRAAFPVYLMEVCLKLPVSECLPDDWFIGFDSATDPIKLIRNNPTSQTYDRDNKHIAGTTKQPATTKNIVPSWNRNEARTYPRRVAFERSSENELVLDSKNPKPLGLFSKSKIQAGGIPTETSDQSLWFRTGTVGSPRYDGSSPLYIANAELGGGILGGSLAPSTDQPLLVPVLQFQTPTGTPAAALDVKGKAAEKGWLQKAEKSTFNLIIASGDAPPRSSPPEPNGGLPNFSRYIENWDGLDSEISGSFIEFKRSSYATGPFTHIVRDNNFENLSRFQYNIPTPTPYRNDNGGGKQPHYMAPNRVYGFDVALLYQLPDLFSATFTQPATSEPSRYFREVDKDNLWVKSLLCAAQEGGDYGSADALYGSGKGYALPESQRPDTCPVE